MFEDIVNRVKRTVTLLTFLGVAAWLVWCGNSYDDKHCSALPAIMCCLTSMVLVLTGAAIVLRRRESEMPE